MDLADADFLRILMRAAGSPDQPCVEERDADKDDTSRYRPQPRGLQDLLQGACQRAADILGLQAGCRDFQHPGEQQDQEHPDVVAPQPAGEGVRVGNEEFRLAGSGQESAANSPRNPAWGRISARNSVSRTDERDSDRHRRSDSAAPRSSAGDRPAAWRRGGRRDAKRAWKGLWTVAPLRL